MAAAWVTTALEEAGGSGWVFTEANYNAGYTSSTHTGGTWGLSTQYFLDTGAYTVPGDMAMPNPNGGTMTGKSGNGYARITLVKPDIVITLSLNGDEEVEVPIGSGYTDAGAKLIKNSVDISDKLVASGSVDVHTAGKYIITYSYYDVETNEDYSVSRTVTVMPDIFDFHYTGSVQKFTAPVTGKYLLEVWGANGGAVSTTTSNGRGGYSKGIVELAQGETVYVYVGGKGEESINSAYINQGGFNGGGAAKNSTGTSVASARTGGGGASDIRAVQDNLYNRIIVSGGGGGNSGHTNNTTAGNGGGPIGANGGYGTGGSQTAGGNSQVATSVPAGFGIGAAEVNNTVGRRRRRLVRRRRRKRCRRRFWICVNTNICETIRLFCRICQILFR